MFNFIEIQNDVEMEVVNEVAPEEHGKEVLVDETQSDDADETASILTKTDYNKEVPSVHTQVSSDGETGKVPLHTCFIFSLELSFIRELSWFG